MTFQPTLILTGLAAGAIAAGIALAPNASAALGSPSCQDGAQSSTICQSPGNYQGTFGPTTQAPSQFGYPFGFLQGF
ncbi:hypothetical protein [Mycolicibacterium sediminis]|uniref:Uncharacterized protein n=1 Tax=Mycolicibacterium sediminis TaxID=1286180 RepID=A0A7I7QWH7_9MYCO|nr:hypothetical protein [Mycolicibacterium sediminis]BBY30674.1 hypothetical protein MSEDJ_47700 [Mycolicibacterium sediminis]